MSRKTTALHDVLGHDLMKRFGLGSNGARNQVAIAVWMAGNLDSHYRRPGPPARPTALPDDDDELMAISRRIGKPRASKADVLNGTLFGAWRDRVQRAEYEGAHRLRLLIWAARSLHEARDEHPELVEERDKIAAFIRDQYGVKIPPIPDEYPNRLLKFCVRFDVMSFELRELRRRRKAPEVPAQEESSW